MGRLLAHPRLPLCLALLAMGLGLPALGLGFQLDDHFLRLALSDPPLDPFWARTSVDLFTFFRGDATNAAVREGGAMPWWAADDIQLAFSRPLTGLTHVLDFRLWPARPELMHAHSLLWMGALVAIATLAFRRLGAPAAGLAALLFAVDGGHGVPAAWIANRNALVATAFALGALVAHHRWRCEGWRAGAVLAPLLLLLGVLGGEMAVGAGGYLVAHALFREEGSWRPRLLALLPCAAVGVTWALAYRALGFGARSSSLYIDPGHPLRFARAVVERGPLLLFGQFALPADLHGLCGPAAARALWGVAVAVCALVAILLLPLLRRDPTARFLAAGMLLAMVPACATFPSDRLLVLASFGGAGLIAQFLAGVRSGADWLPASPGWRRLAKACFWPAVGLHLVLGPLGLLGGAEGTRLLGTAVTRLADGVPDGGLGAEERSEGAPRGQAPDSLRRLPPDPPDEPLVIVQTPSAFATMQALLVRRLAGREPHGAFILSSGLGWTRVERTGDRVLALEVEGGFLAPPGTVGVEGAPPAPAHSGYVLPLLDRLYRDAPMARGDRVRVGGVQVEVLSVTADGRPARVEFQFDVDLATRRFLIWPDGRFAPWTPPPVGARVILPPPSVPF